MSGRNDLPIYRTSCARIVNAITNFKGCVIYRTGWERLFKFQDCVLYEFQFNDQQNYLLVFYAGKIRIMTFDANNVFGWVESSGSPLEISTPYSLAECSELQFARNSDVIYIVHSGHAPRKLTRTGASTFTFSTFSRTNDPFSGGAGNYPSCVCFYGARLFYASTLNAITKLWGSVAGSYDDFSVSSPVDDDDSLTLVLAEISEKIRWLTAGENSMLAGARDGIVAINGGSSGDAITPSNVMAKITSVDGSSAMFPIRKDGLIFYGNKNSRSVHYFSYNILTESYEAPDANIMAHDVSLGGMTKVRWKKDRNDIVYFLKGNGNLATLNFNKDEKIVGWHEHETPGSGENSVEDIAVISDNNGIPFLFGLVKRGSDYYIERKAAHIEFSHRSDFWTGNEENDEEAWYRKICDELISGIYLDSATVFSNHKTTTITYNAEDGEITAGESVFSASDVGHHIVYKTITGYEKGRFRITRYTSATVVSVEVLIEPSSNSSASWYLTFNSVGGLNDYEGTTVSVVTDGAYDNDVAVPVSHEIDLGHECCVVCVGYKYESIIETYPVGFAANGQNAFLHPKSVVSFHILAANSWGGKVGTSRYALQDLPKLSERDLNYLPVYPINGMTKVDYRDDAEIDKRLWFVQDVPAPFHLLRLSAEVSYAV